MNVFAAFDELAPGAAPLTPRKRRTSPGETAYLQAVQVETKPTPPRDGIVLLCGDALTPQPIAWLWPGWLAQGKLHILAGAPGQGKTTIAVTLAATITIGGRFPDGTRCEAGNVLVWSGEDDPADTLLPRMIAAGADRSRVFFVDGARINGEVVPFDPARDMLGLLEAVDSIGGCSLLVVDPVVSAVGGDSHKNGEVRRALQPLVDLAAATGAAVLGVSHFSKAGQGGDPTQRVVGSVAFAAVARVVLVAAKVKSPEGEDRRVLARSKSNIGPDEGGFVYHLDQVEALPGIQAARIAWGGAVAGSARELLTDPSEDDGGSELQSDAAELLRECLTGPGWFPAKDATKTLTDAGFTKKQIWAASKKIHVSRRKGAMSEGWYWRIPDGEQSEDSTEGSTFKNRESSECSESSKVPFLHEDSEGSSKLEMEPSAESSGVRCRRPDIE
ncbi:MAG TPA: AAA family ATPase [Variovorax sp.]|nr:AAA family ATPase [Variovorax sp.]